MKTLVAIVLLLSVPCFGMTKKRVEAPEPSPTAAPSSFPVKSGIGFRCASCTQKETEKVQEAEIVANEIVQGKCFEDFMLGWGLLQTEGKTPKQVVQDIRSQNLTVPVHYYRGKCSVVGYRNPPYPDIYFNRCSHDHYGVCDTASNAVHEWSHVLGYGHPFKRTSWRGRTVPYSINNAFEKCCVGSKGLRTGT